MGNGYHQPPLYVQEHAAVPEGALEVVEPRDGPWTASPTWGQNVVLTTLFAGGTPDLSVPREVIKLPDYGRPQMMTLATALSNEVNNADSYAIVGILRMGSGAGIQEVEFDWLNGTTISFPANSVSVLCRIEGTFGNPPVVPLNISIGAQLALGRRSGCGGSIGGQRTFTNFVAATGVPAATVTIPIPDKARRVLIYDQANVYDANLQVIVASPAGGTLAAFTAADLKPATIAGNGLVLPGGAQNLVLNNIGGVGRFMITVFQLDL